MSRRLTANMNPRSRGDTRPGFAIESPQRQRAWGMPGARCTRSLVCSVLVAHECSHRRRPGSPGIPARNGFNGFLRALLGDRACLSPSSALPSADLTPASRRQDHTTSPSASARFVKRAGRVHRIPSRVLDDRDTPLVGDETAALIMLIWVRRETESFCKQDWTGQITLIRFENLGPARTARLGRVRLDPSLQLQA
jgi:hypothetical protein